MISILYIDLQNVQTLSQKNIKYFSEKNHKNFKGIWKYHARVIKVKSEIIKYMLNEILLFNSNYFLGRILNLEIH